jgi:hypothetical protein
MTVDDAAVLPACAPALGVRTTFVPSVIATAASRVAGTRLPRRAPTVHALC